MLGSGQRRSFGWVPALVLAAVLVLGIVALVGCSSSSTTTTSASATTETTAATTASTEATSTTGSSRVILGSTTSTKDTGLFDVLIPAFEKAYPQYKVEVVAVGSGAALKLGEKGDADVLLVHSPAAEIKFMADGFGLERKPVMYNDFVIVGDPSDPAKIKGMTSATEAFTKIADTKSTFVSRGDDSGTNAKELTIWKAAGITPSGDWYIKTGQGMSATLTVTGEKKGYTLSDRGTYLTTAPKTGLEIMVEGDKILFNPYHVITVKAAKNLAGAQAFATWITGPEGQAVIGSYGVEKYGKPLFTPDANAKE